MQAVTTLRRARAVAAPDFEGGADRFVFVADVLNETVIIV